MKLKTLFADSIALATIAYVTAQDKCGSNFPEQEAVQAASSLRSAHRVEGFSSSFLARIKEKAEALRQGGYDELNIYFETGMMTNTGSATGICSFPVEDPWNTGINGTSWYTYDGCHVSVGTMPGGPGVPWDPEDNKGKTATHEVGHWFGLFHVFDGFDCNGEGDYIDDTPATQVATVGCPVEQDSCPDQPGLDPIHNYMDYSKHDCLSEFTPLQEERMYRSFNTLRLGR
ncbi:Extracellular metalloprotease [Colletotrichum gloeosporioides]|uniref:Extracellular metalloprotease n=1 Tax=Colletotrichum gloeosporioides TaxID=474922 RepID=A0A8H4CD91_COLGL|nr:Extracellular metalloprotease [Colletotrichum gloeosporioides]KAF3801805.1 Extracellular metalloprotease [Colletotrichum gloeosporioides]